MTRRLPSQGKLRRVRSHMFYGWSGQGMSTGLLGS